MKIPILALILFLTTNAFCSRPNQTVSASTIATDPAATFAAYFENADEIYATAADYRGITLKLNRETNRWDCSIPVSYYEVYSWLSEGYEDTKKNGWSRRPSNGLVSRQSDLGSLLGILDQTSIEVKRVSTIRTDRKSKEVRAIWNKLEFSVPKDGIASLYAYLRDFYNDYRPDTEVHIYAKKESNKSEMATPRKPSD